MNWKYRLQTKIITIVLAIVVLCAVISSVISLYRLNIVVKERLDAAGVFSSQALATFSVESLLAWDYPALQLSIKHTAKYDPYILAISIYHKGSLVANYQRETKEEGYEYVAPVVVDVLGKEKEIGTIKIVISEKKYQAFFMQQIYSLIFLGLILGLGDTFLIYLTINRMILIPIRKIEEETEIIGRGDLEHQVDIKSKDEIGRLAQAINSMTKNLKNSMKETEDYKKHLEERVDELERFHKLIIGREMRMIELKRQIKGTEKEFSQKTNPDEMQNCWDFYKCDEKIKKNCPAYKSDSGRECWLVATDYCPYLKEKGFRTCDECPWFKKMQLSHSTKKQHVK